VSISPATGWVPRHTAERSLRLGSSRFCSQSCTSCKMPANSCERMLTSRKALGLVWLTKLTTSMKESPPATVRCYVALDPSTSFKRGRVTPAWHFSRASNFEFNLSYSGFPNWASQRSKSLWFWDIWKRTVLRIDTVHSISRGQAGTL
jgi:hypothetical protein